tara:strand:+ start:2742 stop:4055 length:1314 start_codon:yes stop_codon:yes gene_type:complete
MSSKNTRRQQRKKNERTNRKEMEKMNKKNASDNWNTNLGKKKTPALPSKASCHTGQGLIFTTVEGISVYAGGKNRQGGWHKMNPLPQLAMGPSETLGSWGTSIKTEVPEGWSCEQHLEVFTPPLMLSLDWPDFSIPAVNKYFWYAVIDDIREHGIKTISTQCAGGHGRTGVQLAILAYLLGTEQERVAWPDAGALIDWVREQHCVHAVEAKSQQEYIAQVCGIPIGESKIHEVANNYGFGGWSGKAVAVGHGTATSDEDDEQYTKHYGRIIDQYGADYCPHCGDEPQSMIEYGDLCGECGKDPQDETTSDTTPLKKEKVAIEHCPACDFDIIIDDECTHCGYDLKVGASKSSCECWDCSRRSMDSDTFTDIRCVQCHTIEHAISMKTLKLNPKKGTFNVKCLECKKFTPSNLIADTKTGEGYVCFKCNVKPKKEVKV